jgi:hypothetical protein
MTAEIPKNGLFTDFYANSQIKKTKGNLKDGKEDGKWTNWYENGQIKSEINYKDGKLDGKWIEWDESGRKQSEVNYKDGKVLLENKLKEIEFAQTHLGLDIPINTREMKNKNESKGTKTVKISDIDIPFGSMVVFMVKWAIASIPAFFILMFLFAIFSGFFLGIISMLN